MTRSAASRQCFEYSCLCQPRLQGGRSASSTDTAPGNNWFRLRLMLLTAEYPTRASCLSMGSQRPGERVTRGAVRGRGARQAFIHLTFQFSASIRECRAMAGTLSKSRGSASVTIDCSTSALRPSANIPANAPDTSGKGSRSPPCAPCAIKIGGSSWHPATGGSRRPPPGIVVDDCALTSYAYR